MEAEGWECGMEGLRRRPPGRQGQLTHRPLGLSSGGSSGGGGSAAPGAPGGEMLASAAASRPIPGSGGGGCGGRPASQAARPRPGPDPRPPPPPPPRPAGPARLPCCTLGPWRGAGERTARGRAPRAACGGCGGEAQVRRVEVPAPARLGRLRPPPRPHRAPSPPPPAGLCSRRWAGGASDRSLGPPPLRASRVCNQMCVCECVCAPLPVTVRAPAHGPARSVRWCVRDGRWGGSDCVRLACAWV